MRIYSQIPPNLVELVEASFHFFPHIDKLIASIFIFLLIGQFENFLMKLSMYFAIIYKILDQDIF